MVDAHPVFRLGLVSLLGTLTGITVVGQADSAAAARRLLDPPATPGLDVVLMDVDLGDGSGIEGSGAPARPRWSGRCGP